jgi:large subunit ribosomal protein L18
MITKSRHDKRARIKFRVRKKIKGTAARPRLTVYRSLHHLYAQIIDDSQSKVITMASTLSKDLRDDLKGVKEAKERAKRVGMLVARLAMEKEVKEVVFDRNGYMYHGVVKSLADGAREGGLKF